jgi:acetyl-CoA acetyltransferase
VKEVALIGQGLHPWGKFKDKSVNDLLRVSVDNALADAGIEWPEIQAVACASSRFSGGRGWGLNGNDVVEDMGATGVPVYNLSAGCAAGGNAFNVGYSLIAGGIYDMVLVVGGEKMPKGFIQTSGVEEAPALCGYARPGVLGCHVPPSHGRLRNHRRTTCEDRRQGACEFRRQRIRAVP